MNCIKGGPGGRSVKEICNWDLDTVGKNEGYYRKSVPESTLRNMQVYMDKINELVKEVNRLNKELGL